MFLNRNRFDSPLVLSKKEDALRLDTQFEKWCLIQLQSDLHIIFSKLDISKFFNCHTGRIVSISDQYCNNVVIGDCRLSLPGSASGIKDIIITGERKVMDNAELNFEVSDNDATLFIDFPNATFNYNVTNKCNISLLNEDNPSHGVRFSWNIYDNRTDVIHWVRKFLKIYVWYVMYFHVSNKRVYHILMNELEFKWESSYFTLYSPDGINFKRIRNMFRALDVINEVM